MSDTNTFVTNLKKSTGLRLLVLFGSFVLLLVATSVISEIIKNSTFFTTRQGLLAASALQCIFAFCIPAWLAARYASVAPMKWLGMAKVPTFKSLIGVIIVYILALPAMNCLIEWNASLHLPASLSSIEQTLRGWEEANANVSRQLLDANGIMEVISGILVVGILAGLSEEMFFRGALQRIFADSGMGITFAIWGAAFIFSTFHFQFFGFFPRWIMGVFFGYLLVWTGSLWVAVFAHVLNNSIVVVSEAFASQTGFMESIGTGVGSFPVIMPLSSAIITIVFLLWFGPFFFKSNR